MQQVIFGLFTSSYLGQVRLAKPRTPRVSFQWAVWSRSKWEKNVCSTEVHFCHVTFFFLSLSCLHEVPCEGVRTRNNVVDGSTEHGVPKRHWSELSSSSEADVYYFPWPDYPFPPSLTHVFTQPSSVPPTPTLHISVKSKGTGHNVRQDPHARPCLRGFKVAVFFYYVKYSIFLLFTSSASHRNVSQFLSTRISDLVCEFCDILVPVDAATRSITYVTYV